MKYALVIPDGCADEPQELLGGRTPLEAARTPHMDALARAGMVGRADHVPACLPSGSDVGTMSLFGYDPLAYHTGRAPIEAAARGIDLGPRDWAIRCNLVTIDAGRMVSFTAGQIANQPALELMRLLREDQCGGSTWKFHAGVSYRNLLIYRARNHQPPFTKATTTTPPHDVTDQLVDAYLPQGPGADQLRRLMDRSTEIFRDAAPNLARVRRGELPASGIWLWGLGTAPVLEPFQQRFGIDGAVITAVDLLRGLARLIGWRIIEVPGATGYLDTDYTAKGRAAVEALQSDSDLIAVHVEATDEASHEGDAHAKVCALERIDEEIVGPLRRHLEDQGDYRMLVSPDHPTLLRTKTHSHGYVPFALCGTGITADEAESYSETTANDSHVAMDGYRLMELFLGKPAQPAGGDSQ